MTHVRLAMLARDEEAAIPLVARAVGDLVDDYVVLVDHRTTDDTEGAIERELGPGITQPFRFRDFAHARNWLFDVARRDLDADDYLLLVDPDSPPTGSLPPDLREADSWSCTWQLGTDAWHLPILVRVGVDCHYEGAAHELLVGVSPVWTPLLSVSVASKPFNPERAAEWAEALRPGAEAGEPRAAFYLARTLRDLGRRGEAIEWYLRRAQMGDAGWIEETFVCLLDAGVLLIALDLDLARVVLERAAAFRPERLEPLYHLAWIANYEGDHEAALALATFGVNKPRSSDALFVNRWVERHGLVDEMNKAIAGGARPPETITTMEAEDGESLRC